MLLARKLGFHTLRILTSDLVLSVLIASASVALMLIAARSWA